jgi:hypothetical protein
MGKRILAYCHKRRQLAVGSVAFVDRAMTKYGKSRAERETLGRELAERSEAQAPGEAQTLGREF